MKIDAFFVSIILIHKKGVLPKNYVDRKRNNMSLQFAFLLQKVYG